MQWHTQAEKNDLEEADQVCQLIQQQPDNKKIAVLARSRAHLAQIAQALQKAGINYQAINVNPLAQRTLIQGSPRQPDPVRR